MKDLILNALSAAGNDTVEIGYQTGTTSTNGEYIDITIGDRPYKRIVLSRLSDITQELERTAAALGLHAVKRETELHFAFSNFNSCQTKALVVALSKTIHNKPGIIKEQHSQVGAKTVLAIINAHPDYQLFLRSGFAMRGAEECAVGKETLTKALSAMACADVKVVADEIHVNTFSLNDMW